MIAYIETKPQTISLVQYLVISVDCSSACWKCNRDITIAGILYVKHKWHCANLLLLLANYYETGVLTAGKMKVNVLWEVIPCSLVDRYQRFR
jgi:hypothetical protein